MIGSNRRKTSHRLVLAVAAAAAGVLALAGCAGSAGPNAGEGGRTSMTVVTFLPLESFTFTPEMYAYSGGYFTKHGLDVTLQPVQGSSAAIQSLLGGAATITRASTVDVFGAMEAGQPIRAVGTMAYKSNLRMVSVDSDPITSPRDIRGKVIGMGSVGGTSEKLLDLTLGAAGVPLDSVSRQAVPVTAATLEVVRQGQLDGYIVSLDTSLAIAQKNADAVVEEAGLVDAPDIQTWLTTESTLKDEAKAAQVTAFLAAIREAVQAVIDDAPNGYATVLKTLRDSGDWNFPALADDKIATAALDVYTTKTWVDADSSIALLQNDREAWKRTYDTYAKAGMVAGGKDPSAWMTDDYLTAR